MLGSTNELPARRRRPARSARLMFYILTAGALAGCGGGGGGGGGDPIAQGCDGGAPDPNEPACFDIILARVIADEGLTGDPAAGRQLPSIDDPLPQLGKLLFFSKSLGGDLDTACASCHHPALGGGDGLSLPVGTGAVDPDVVGVGRSRPDGLPNVGRHSQTVFNIGLYDASLFWDARIESINKEAGQNGAQSGIRTPDTAFGVADPLVAPGMTLPAAQARFPVTVPEEMLGEFLPGADGNTVRAHLAARIGDYGAGQGELATNDWLAEFQTAFASAQPAEELITFDNIALAIAEYQRSMVFVDTPWKAYVEGDTDAIDLLTKRGAILFFGDPADEGLGCAECHGGDFFTDERNSLVGFPQIGPGKGDGPAGDEDFGIEQHTANPGERFRFRTPTLLNLAATAPYTHAGVFESLSDAGGHYVVPGVVFDGFLAEGGICSLAQFEDHPDCATLFPNMVANSEAALDEVLAVRIAEPEATFPDLTDRPVELAPALLAFLEALTDPCTLDRACLAPWIPEPGEAPDENQLNAVDRDGNPL